MSTGDGFWQAKLSAWLHDPAEKSLVLFRDPVGHERGTVAALRKELFGQERLPAGLDTLVSHADWWASAADRPKFPGERGGGRLGVDWVTDPVLVHPLSGQDVNLASLWEDFPAVDKIKALSLDHFRDLIARNPDGTPDFRATFLRFWRLGQETPAPGLGGLWSMLPADTRIPDHGIFEHLRLVSAFAGAMHGSEVPALLSVSLGPVQSFIAQARTTSDLWAGSHLLSRMAWEAMRVVCEELGPDSILLPDLFGIPQVDVWLEDNGVEFRTPPGWKQVPSDANPLFAAALPNRFVALVPASRGSDLAQKVVARVRMWAVEQAQAAWRRILEESGAADGERGSWQATGRAQVERQFDGFPDVTWTLVRWDLIDWDREKQTIVSRDRLTRALEVFFDPESAEALAAGDKAFAGDLGFDGETFFRPNPGLAYPALHALSERAHAAAKTGRVFSACEQEGYRCDLCGEREWLTGSRDELVNPPGRRGRAAIWNALSSRRPSWSRKGESLCARCTLKRLWPVLFVEELQGRDWFSTERGGPSLARFVVSTHAMALAPTLAKLGRHEGGGEHWDELRTLVADSSDRAALPRKLHRDINDTAAEDMIRRIPVLLDEWREEASAESERKAEALRRHLGELTKSRAESYYALILMDGDHMGRWLGGDMARKLESVFHPAARSRLLAAGADDVALSRYLQSRRPLSPGYHAAISRALNGFALHVVPRVVEERHLGKLLYAGGDDLLAMVGLDDLLDLMAEIRAGFSGCGSSGSPGPAGAGDLTGAALPADPSLRLRSGYGLLVDRDRKRLVRLMGETASASMGVVVAHHMAPLQGVLAALRAAEKRSKDGGRDAFTITLLKRSGGTTYLTCPFGTRAPAAAVPGGNGGDDVPGGLATLRRLRGAFADLLSRQAAYHVLEWLPDLPVPGTLGLSADSALEMLRRTIAQQFLRQRRDRATPDTAKELEALAADLARLATATTSAEGGDSPGEFLGRMVTVAEFLAREGRAEKLQVATAR